MLLKFIGSYLWIALLVSILIFFTDHKIIPGDGTWNIPELRTIDLRFLARPKPVTDHAKDIALIVIDSKSYEQIRLPLIFYNNHIAGIIDYLVRSGAKVIGLDIQLPSISLEDKVSGGYDRVYTRALLKARKEGTDVVIGYSSPLRAKEVKKDDEETEGAPLQAYLQAAGQDNLSYFGLTDDIDDVIRRQQLFFEVECFPLMLARKYSGSSPAVSDQTILIDYTLARDIPIYSLNDIYKFSLQNSGPDLRFKDKVVIIGTSMPFMDKHSTPLRYLRSEDKMTSGVIIQGATVNTLLSGSIFRELTRSSEAFYIFIVSVLAMLLCFNRRPIPAAFLCSIEAVAVAGVSIYAFNHDYVVRIIPLFSAVLLSYAFTTIFHYYSEEKKRIKIRQRFASYVPENIIEQMMHTDVEKLIEGEQREVVLFFSDIRGFTPYSEKNKEDPKKIVNFLNEYHKEVTEIILSNGGTVSQLIGDGTFAFFGAPTKLDDPEFSALKAAVSIKEMVTELKPKWQQFGMEDLRIGIGIHVGDVIVGNMGSVRKMTYAAIGDNTNLAARIEGLTKDFHETILVSGAVYERVNKRVNARALGSAKIKGHSEVEIFAVDGIIT